MLRALFFDLGGTLVDISDWNSDEAFAYDLEVLHSLGTNLSLSQCRREFDKARLQLNALYKGSPKRHQTGLVFTTVCKNLGLSTDPKIAIETDYKVLNELLKKAKLAEGAIELLKWGKSKGMKLALITNGSIMRTNALIDRFGLRGYFDCVLISEEVGYEKSTGVPFKAALRKLGLFPEQVIMIGDNPEEDEAGAKKAGIKALLVESSGLKSLQKALEKGS